MGPPASFRGACGHWAATPAAPAAASEVHAQLAAPADVFRSLNREPSRLWRRSIFSTGVEGWAAVCGRGERMDTWPHVVAWVVGLFLLDRWFVWMERKGWIYWRGVSPVTETTQEAMPRCADCSYPVSRRALSCPACGRLLRPLWLLSGALLVAALSVGLWRTVDMLLAAR